MTVPFDLKITEGLFIFLNVSGVWCLVGKWGFSLGEDKLFHIKPAFISE
jgi:hypothetical protein